MRPLTIIALLALAFVAAPVAADDSPSAPAAPAKTAQAPRTGAAKPEHQRLAAAYSASTEGVSMLVMIDGEIVFEDYPTTAGPTTAHLLASGTKSFTGAIAVAAQMDGLLTLDEKVAETITEWKGDERRSRITIRQLLSLTSGLDSGQNLRPPTYADAITYPSQAAPGTRFRYGPVPFQVFGEVMRRKLAQRESKRPEGPLEYLKRRVLDPIGLEVAEWSRGEDGNPFMPHGAALTAREWAKYGELVRLGGKQGDVQVLDRKLLDACFRPSKAFRRYGISWWLPKAKLATRVELPADLVLAAGLGKQKLWVSRTESLVVVRQAPLWNKAKFDDDEFLARLLHGTTARGKAIASPPAKPSPAPGTPR